MPLCIAVSRDPELPPAGTHLYRDGSICISIEKSMTCRHVGESSYTYLVNFCYVLMSADNVLRDLKHLPKSLA